MTPRLDYVATFTIETGTPVDIGPGARLVPVVGGIVQGPRLAGRILGGGDWQRPEGDNVTRIDGRWVMECADGARIEVATPGLRHARPDITAALGAGKMVDPSHYYFRVAPVFSTADPAYGWLARSLFLGQGRKGPDGVEIAVFAVA